MTNYPSLYLSQNQLDNLKLYKYSGIDNSFLSRYILNPFWNRLVLLFPLWMAPNLITLIGLGFMIWGSISVLLFPFFKRLINLNLAVCISTYLNMDAIDGKQARRTGTSGPLGEFFDHGCDAINMMLMALIVPFIFNLDLKDESVLAMSLAGYLAFYASTWEEFHTGTLYLGYFSGPVEGAWTVTTAAIVSALLGPSFWDSEVISVSDSFKIKEFVSILFFLGSIWTIRTSALHVIQATKSFKPVLAGLSIPITYGLSCLALIPSIRDLGLEKWFIFFTGFPACFRISHTILAYITKSPLQNSQPYLIELFPVAFFILQRFWTDPEIWSSAFKTATIFSASIYLITMLLIIHDISRHLSINCLTIKRRE